MAETPSTQVLIADGVFRIEDLCFDSEGLAVPNNNFKESQQRARQLLENVMAAEDWRYYLKHGHIRVKQFDLLWRIRHGCRTVIERMDGRFVGWSCLQLTAPAPEEDRMVMEYLMLKGNPDCYLTNANISIGNGLKELLPKVGWLKRWKYSNRENRIRMALDEIQLASIVMTVGSLIWLIISMIA